MLISFRTREPDELNVHTSNSSKPESLLAVLGKETCHSVESHTFDFNGLLPCSFGVEVQSGTFYQEHSIQVQSVLVFFVSLKISRAVLLRTVGM